MCLFLFVCFAESSVYKHARADAIARENCKVPMDGFLMINIENKSALLTVLGNGLKRCTRGSCRSQLLRSTIFFFLFHSPMLNGDKEIFC